MVAVGDDAAMASFFEAITTEQRALIEEAPVFFVATADPRSRPGPDGQGTVNVSPKGGSPPIVLDDRTWHGWTTPGRGTRRPGTWPRAAS